MSITGHLSLADNFQYDFRVTWWLWCVWCHRWSWPIDRSPQKLLYYFKTHRRGAALGPPLPPSRSISFLVSHCLPIFSPYVPPSSSLSVPSQTAQGAILCHFISLLLHFHRVCALLSATIKPFHASLKFPRPPPRSLPLFPSVCLPLSVSSSLSLPPCSAHLQHIKIPPSFLQRIAQSLRDLLHSSLALPLPLSLHFCLSLFGSTTQFSIQHISSFVLLTHLCPSPKPPCVFFLHPSLSL